MFEYILEYKMKKILLVVPSKTNLKDNVCNKLNSKLSLNLSPPEITLHCFHHELQTYYEVDETDAPNKGLIKVVDASSVLDPSQDAFENIWEVEPETTLQACSSQGDADRNVNTWTPNKPKGSLDGSGNIFSSWAKNFRLETNKMPPSLRRALEEKMDLNKPLRSALMDFLYEEVTKYTFYPKRAECIDIIESLFEKYPHLEFGLDRDASMDLWVSRLQEKMRNGRKRRDRDRPCVEEKRRSFKKQLGPAIGLKGYLVPQPDSENESSIAKHKMLMQQEWLKPQPDMCAIAMSMTITYSDRRDMIVNKRATIPEIKLAYPILFDAHQLCYEFFRLSSKDITRLMEERIAHYAPGLLALNKPTVNNSPTKEELGAGAITSFNSGGGSIAMIPMHSDQLPVSVLQVDHKPIPHPLPMTSNDSDWHIASAVACIPELMREKVFFQAIGEYNTAAPTIVVHGDLRNPQVPAEVVANGTRICTAEGILHAFTAWFSSYFVFNFTYPKAYKRTLLFVQIAIMDHRDKSKNTMVLSTIRELNRIIASKGV